MSSKQASATIYIIFFLVILLAFSAFAVDGTIVLTNRAKLQNAVEMTALSAASEYGFSLTATPDEIKQRVSDTAANTFSILKQNSLQTADIEIVAQTLPNKVTITANMISQPFFLQFLGISGIRLEARACAQSEELSVKANYQGINWLTVSAAYLSDILSKDLETWNDTAILLPLGNFKSASYEQTGELVNFNFLDSSEDRNSNGQLDPKPLSLGPGGFITIKLPAPIIDKPGYDLFIKESGSLEGYFVFVGLDVDPNDPYVQAGKEGKGISWINISCSGKPQLSDTNGLTGAYSVSTDSATIGNQAKFYGSGYFDIGASCITRTANDISMAKYIRIIDDNSESAFVTTNQTDFYKSMLYGEASTATAGADIDNVRVLNHVRLVPSI